MNTAYLAILSLCGGIVLGAAWPVSQRLGGAGPAEFSAGRSGAVALPPAGGPQPVAEVEQAEFDFGAMERGTTRSHTFRVTNRGDYPLELRAGPTSCKCTISELNQSLVEPGESVDVRLEWTARTVGVEFREIATILTNDPARRRLDLVVRGRLTDTLRVEPAELFFSKMMVGEPAVGALRVLSFRDQPLEILAHRIRDEKEAPFFKIATAAVATENRSDKDAKSELEVTVAIEPGLPVGTFSVDLELETNLEGREKLVIPIEGRIASEITIRGPGWNEEEGILSLGVVRGTSGMKRRLSMSVRGEGAADVQFRVVSAEPECLQVRFGESKASGRVLFVPLEVEIPAATRPVNRLGNAQAEMGEILIETTHPRAKRLKLLVRFAVEA